MKLLFKRKILAISLSALLMVSTLSGCSGDKVLSKDEDLLRGVKPSASVTAYDFTSEATTTPEGYSSYCENVTEFSLSLLRASWSDSRPAKRLIFHAFRNKEPRKGVR